MQHPTFRRRRLVVDRPFQWSLCLHGIGLGVLVLVAVSAGIFVPLLWNLGERFPSVQVDPDTAVVMVYMHERFWLVAAVCLVLVTIGALRLSHRIAGPMVRYKRNLRLLAEGRLPPPLRTRRRDYLKDEVACLNAAVDGVRERVEAIRKAEAQLRRQLQVVAERLPRGAAELAGLAEAEARLARAVGAFTETGQLDAETPPEPAVGVVLAFAGRMGRED
jgi:methyl-accepting chemotaxis protein